MLIVGDVFVDEDIVESHFVCDLQKCKGICCAHESTQTGAEVTESEQEEIAKNYHQVEHLLSEEAKQSIAEQGTTTKEGYTPLYQESRCVYSIKDDSGTLKCGIEQAYENGESSFRKPISCHLAPIRILNYEKEGEKYDVLMYKHYSMCDPACDLGNALKVPLYKFLQNSLERKYGKEWFESLEKEVEEYKKSK
ncbi:MAG: hypothetical protein ACI85I_000931 [Arenicella sp.]|jgi:hypothetical protein